ASPATIPRSDHRRKRFPFEMRAFHHWGVVASLVIHGRAVAMRSSAFETPNYLQGVPAIARSLLRVDVFPPAAPGRCAPFPLSVCRSRPVLELFPSPPSALVVIRPFALPASVAGL